MRRSVGRSSRIVILVVSVVIALSMACSFIPSLLRVRQPTEPTPPAAVAPSPTPTQAPQP